MVRRFPPAARDPATMKRSVSLPAGPRLAGALLLAPLLLSGCLGIHTFQQKKGPSDEQLLELYTTTATYLYEDDSLVRAQDQAVKALEIEPRNRPMRRMIAWIRLRMGSPEDLTIARQFFETLRKEGDDNQATTLGLATTLERLGVANDAASRAYARGERTPPEGVDAETQATELAKRARDLWGQSLELYQETLTQGEGSTSGINGLQRVHALLGNLEESLRYSEELLARSGEELVTWRRMLTQEDLTEREESFFRENERIAVTLQSDTHLFASTILNRLGRPDEAIEHLDAVVAEEPELPQAYSLRAQLRKKVGDYQGAIEDLDQFLRLSDQPFEHPDVKRAFELRVECEAALAK